MYCVPSLFFCVFIFYFRSEEKNIVATHPNIFFVLTLHIMPFANTSIVIDEPVAFVTLETNRTLQSICSLNHLGVSYFNHGSYSDAILCFKGATATLILKSLFNEQGSKNSEEQMTCRCYTSLLVMPLPEKLSTPQPASVEEAQVANAVISMHRRMYSCPFEIVAMTKNLNDTKQAEHVLVDEQLLFSKLSIVLIFNLAMTHHSMAVAMMAKDSYTTSTTAVAPVSAPRDLLLKACSLYSLAYSIPQNDLCLAMIWPVMLTLFAEAILSNLGHCYASLDDTKNAVQCFELLLQSMMLVQQDHIYKRLGEEDETSNRCPYDTSLCFADSILFLILKDPGFASAA
jgi:Tetratricopeptide repeat